MPFFQYATTRCGLLKFDKEDGHLRLERVFISGNIVPKSSKFYYIEPGIEQTISYLTLITEPRELIMVWAKFSMEQTRIFPKKLTGDTGLKPHTAARTYQLDAENTSV